MKEYLFLGGRMDGRKLEVADDRKVVKILGEWQPRPLAAPYLGTGPIYRYHRVNLRCFGPTGHEVVFTFQTRWTETRVVQHFLTNYRKS